MRFLPSRWLPALICASLAVWGLLSLGQPAMGAGLRSVSAPPSSGVTLAADDGVMVHEAWARASAGAATTGAAYIMLMGGARPDSLVSVSTPVAATAAVHETINDNGVMKMRPVPILPISPGQMMTFAPSGTHIMLMGLKHKLTAGESFPMTLTFAHATPVTVQVLVRAMAQGAPSGGHDHGRM